MSECKMTAYSNIFEDVFIYRTDTSTECFVFSWKKSVCIFMEKDLEKRPAG